MKKENNTFKLNGKFVNILDKIVETGIPLEVGLGKYSCFIKTKNDNVRYKFITTLQSKLTFVGYAKILKDLKRPEVQAILSDMKDNVHESDNLYFNMGKYESNVFENAVCVDLNSAYLQALFNLSLITESTKIWIEVNLSKKERLVCVGMLAKQKEIIHFLDGKIMQDYKEVSELRFIFNAVIQEVNRVMTAVQNNYLDDFLAYWVDGIYLQNEYMAMEVQDMFQAAGFPCKIEYLKDFKSEFKFTYMAYSYYKDGVYKVLHVPIKEIQEEMRKNLTRSINNRRRGQNLGAIDTTPYISDKKYTQADLFN